MPTVFLGAGGSVSSASKDSAQEDQYSKDYYDERPEDVPEVDDDSACLQKQA